MRGKENLEAREHAEWLVRYFGRLARETGEEVWQYGLEASQEWRRLINAPSAGTAEVLALVGVVRTNRTRSSGWYDLSLAVYSWAYSNGFPVPEPEEFHHTEELPGVTPGLLPEEVSPHEYAKALIKQFAQHAHEDPNQDLWKLGKEAAQEWLRLIEATSVSRKQISDLIERAYPLDHHGMTWFSLAWGVCYWSYTKGYSDLLPEDMRHLIEIE